MIFRQLFDQASGIYSYLLANRLGGEALIIDPVLPVTRPSGVARGWLRPSSV
jgi:hypothetical protein